MNLGQVVNLLRHEVVSLDRRRVVTLNRQWVVKLTGACINTGIERVLNDDMILKHIGLLIQHKDFKRHSDKGFTLVFHKYADYQNHVDEIIKPYGKFIIDDAWMSKEIAPVMEDFFKKISTM